MFVSVQGESREEVIPVKMGTTGTAEEPSQISRVRFLRDDEWPQGWAEIPFPDAQVPHLQELK